MRNFILLVFLPTVMMLFHNCGEFIPAGKQNKGLSCSIPDLFPTFTTTYYNFFQSNGCVNCHAPGTGNPGIPHFANPSSPAGFASFNGVGPVVVENKLKNGHQAYNYSNLSSELASHKTTWLEAQSKIICNDGTGGTTEGKSISFFEPTKYARNKVVDSLVTVDNPGTLDELRYMTSWQTITWDLSKKVSGLEVSVDFKADVDSFNYPVAYRVNNIKVRSAESRVRIKSVTVMLNDNDYTVTTFQGIDAIADVSANFVDLNPGGADAIYSKDVAIDGDYSNDDQWSVKVELIEIVP